MRAAAFAVAGALVGMLVAAGLIYFAGLALGAMGWQLYSSEGGQQRNFNLALMFVLVMAALGAWRGYRLGRR